MTYEENMNAKVLIKFMRGLIKDSSKKVFLILDNLRVHHAKVVKTWLSEHNDKIEVFHLPEPRRVFELRFEGWRPLSGTCAKQKRTEEKGYFAHAETTENTGAGC